MNAKQRRQYRRTATDRANRKAFLICERYESGDLDLRYIGLIDHLPPNMPEVVTGDFKYGVAGGDSSSNVILKNLIGMPREVHGRIELCNVYVDSLEGVSTARYFHHRYYNKLHGPYMGFTNDEYQEFIKRRSYRDAAVANIDPSLGFSELLDVL